MSQDWFWRAQRCLKRDVVVLCLCKPRLLTFTELVEGDLNATLLVHGT